MRVERFDPFGPSNRVDPWLQSGHSSSGGAKLGISRTSMIRGTRHKWLQATTKLFSASEQPTQPPVDPTNLPYRLRDHFLTEEEDRLRHRLCEAVGERAIVCPKTRVSDVLWIPQAHQHLGDAVRIDRKFIDFLICDRISSRPVCAVQLDRWREDAAKYQLRDEFLERVLAAAGLAVLHVQAQRIPTVTQFRQRITPLIENRG